MKKAAAILLAAALTLLSGCGAKDGMGETPAVSAAEPPAASEPAISEPAVSSEAPAQSTQQEEFVSETDAEGNYTVMVNGDVFWTDGYTVREPENTVDITTARLSDFGDHFTTRYPVTTDTYKLCAGTKYEIEVLHIASEDPGPTVYIVSGIHGDEIGGWYAGTLLKEMTLSCGEVYLIAPANVNGAKNGTRYVTGKQDLNRSFPGGSSDAGRIAAAIYGDIADKQPELLLDLHEAIVYTDGRDFLGSTLIFTDLAGMEDLFFDVLMATQTGEICQGEFGYTGPGPDGSINATVTNELKIPAITVETFRGYNIERRITEQLDIVEHILAYKGMI